MFPSLLAVPPTKASREKSTSIRVWDFRQSQRRGTFGSENMQLRNLANVRQPVYTGTVVWCCQGRTWRSIPHDSLAASGSGQVDDSSLPSRLSQIDTQWTLLRQSHGPVRDQAHRAQTRLVERYRHAIYRYLVASLRDADAADEVFQEFALRFIRGSFRRAEAGQGRFRDYLKTVLSRLMVDYWRKRNRQPRGAAVQVDKVELPKDSRAGADPFEQAWREEILRRVWEALETQEQQTGQPYYQVLRYRTRHPGQSSAEMASGLSGQLAAGRVCTSVAVRKLLQRARERFADLLVEEVAASLGTTDRGCVEDELAELGLLPYCRTAVRRRNQEP